MESALPKKIAFFPAVMFVAAAGVSLALPYLYPFLSMPGKIGTYLGGCLFVFGAAFLLRRLVRGIFIPALFFSVFLLYFPVIVLQESILPFSFLGVNFLIPSIAFVIALKIVARKNGTDDWFRRGHFAGTDFLLIAVVLIFSAAALFLWVVLLDPDLKGFTEMMPAAGVPLLILGGLGFAGSNAFVEEVMFRGFFMDGLLRTVSLPWAVILVQAAAFGALHFRGFPGGFVGMGMVFVWGIFLSVLRLRTRGFLAPYLAHLGADLTIFFILFGIIM